MPLSQTIPEHHAVIGALAGIRQTLPSADTETALVVLLAAVREVAVRSTAPGMADAAVAGLRAVADQIAADRLPII